MTAHPAPRRKAVPLSTQVLVLLRMLGMQGCKINWSHEPALGLRAINDAGTDYDPPQLDPNYIVARPKEDHDRITFKNNGTGRGDLTAIAHVKRTARRKTEHDTIMIAKANGERIPARPKRKIASRSDPWPQGRKLQSRNDLRRRSAVAE